MILNHRSSRSSGIDPDVLNKFDICSQNKKSSSHKNHKDNSKEI